MLFRSSGIKQKLDQGALNPQKVMDSGIKLLMAAVCLDTGKLHYINERGQVLDRKYQPVYEALQRTDLPLSPECLAIQHQISELEANIELLQADAQEDKHSGIYYQIKQLNAELAGLRQQLQAAMIHCGALAVAPLTVPLREATIASASIPGVFEPVTMCGKTYVDGGIRENLPLQAALDLGATRVFAIAAGRDGLAAEDCSSLTAPAILLRSIDIMLDEVGVGDATPSPRTPAEITMIRPSFEVHSPLDVVPGLIRINMAYGYMRAADAMISDAEQRAAAELLADEITRLRRDLYLTEITQILNHLSASELKQQIRAKVAERRRRWLTLPDDADTWGGAIDPQAQRYLAGKVAPGGRTSVVQINRDRHLVAVGGLAPNSQGSLTRTWQEFDAVTFAGWHNPEDLQFTGDFLRLGHDQVLLINRHPEGGRVMITDLYGTTAPQVKYWENWGEHQLLNGWHEADDIVLAGDFMGLGCPQLMFINVAPGGGRVMVADFSRGAAPAQVRYWENWGQSPMLNGWHNPGDVQLVGDFMGLGRDQVLFINQDPSGGRVLVADFGDGQAPAEVKYWENWGQSPMLNGWHDAGDLKLVGDFMGLKRDQVLFINRTGGSSRLMIADFADGKAPVEVKYWEYFGEHPLLNGWQDTEDLALAGDFIGGGYDQVLFVNQSRGGARVMVADFRHGKPARVRYWEE